MTAGVYLHIPFCRSRCSYCDFATDVYRDSGAVERYVDALCAEIRNAKFDARPAADTIYFGGGTPSLLEAEQVKRVIEVVRERFDVVPGAEVTMEMNPGTVSAEKLAAYRALGVNRASFGVQTFNDHHLKLLARGHSADDARTTFAMLREAGFENISFDLIAGLPGQPMDDWRENLDKAIALEPDHLSLYLLEIHEGTPLAEQVTSGRRPVPDEELAARMYEWMEDVLGEAGYAQYEISNFAKPGYESRHNVKYWMLEPVYGFGVSAHSFDGRERYANERDTNKYVGLMGASGGAEVFREKADIASETAFLGLRLNRGIAVAEYEAQFGIDLGEKIASLAERGLVENRDGRLVLTRNGRLFSNDVFAEFV